MLQPFVTRVREHLKLSVSTLVVAFLVVLFLLPSAGVSAQSLTLDIDVQPLFDAINQFFPVLFPVVAIGGGLSIAIALAMFLIRVIRGAFGGGGD